MNRRNTILEAIVKSFIKSASPISSSFVREKFNLKFSTATIRSEMLKLEHEGFLFSPYKSAGKVPTKNGFRFFVDRSKEKINKKRTKIEEEFKEVLFNIVRQRKQDEKAYNAVSVLNRLSPNLAFITVPSRINCFFLGVSSILSQPEFSGGGVDIAEVFQTIEIGFYNILEDLNISSGVQVFIGNESLKEEIKNCSLIVSSFFVDNYKGYIGILGPIRMDYEKNIIAVDLAKDFLEGDE